LYVEDGLTNKEIGERLGCHKHTVKKWRIRHDVGCNLFECPDCGGEYQQLAHHWRQSPCDQPSITSEQAEIITGVLMGDGTIVNKDSDRDPQIAVRSVESNFLEHLNESLGYLTCGIHERDSETVETEHGLAWYDEHDIEPNFQDQYTLYGRSHPGLEQWAEWYSGGSKSFPTDLDLTPTVIKYWFVGDGTVQRKQRDDFPRIQITSKNEKDRLGWLCSLFDNYGLNPTPYSDRIDFTPTESRRLYGLMGDPVPGFEYKWPSQHY
jgi:hypothetical protein